MKIFRMSDYEWYAAEDLESAIKCYMDDTGVSREDVDDDEPCEISQDEMDGLIYHDHEAEPPIEHSFAVQLAIELKDGRPFPRFFAGTEY
ncbi:MAG: hypothetical protein ACXU8A_00050 [Burkholderiaceae bacterium]